MKSLFLKEENIGIWLINSWLLFMYFSTSFSIVNNLLINCLLFSLVRSLSTWENLHALVVEYPAPTLGVMDDHKDSHSPLLSSTVAMNLEELWSKTCSNVKLDLNEETFSRWIAIIRPLAFQGNELRLGVENEFTGNWIKDNYLDTIMAAAQAVLPNEKLSVELVIDGRAALESNELKHSEPRPSKKGGAGKAVRKSECIGTLNPKFTFDEFVVGPSNSFAHAAAVSVATKPGKAYNPLFIYGGTGLGKTHLMQAIGNRVMEQPGKIVAYISTETLLNEYITAIQTNSTVDFRTKYRNVDVLMIDDIQFLASKKGLQEEFFHTFNALYNDRKQIVLTSDRPATEIADLEERLVSRFNAGLATEIECPNFETRLAILRYKLASQSSKPLSDDIQDFIAENVKSNVRTLEGAMNRVLSFNELSPEPLTIENLRYILRDLLEKEKEEDLSLDSIQNAVADFFHIQKTDLFSKERTRSIADTRMVAMYLCRRLTKHSYPEIGASFAKTHGAVMNACKVIQGRMSLDSERELRQNLRAILQKLGQDPASLGV